MVPSGMIPGVPRDMNSGSVKQERWFQQRFNGVDANGVGRTFSDPPVRIKEEKVLKYEPLPAGTVVRGVRIDGTEVVEMDIELDAGFDMSPIAERVGFPLGMRRLPQPPTASAGRDVKNQLSAVRMMTEPGIGLPMTWQGTGETLAPLLVVRPDGVPFLEQDWRVFVDYIEYLHTEVFEDEQEAETLPSAFVRFIEGWVSTCAARADQRPYAFMDLAPHFAFRFPMGMKVKAVGLNARPELNGKRGLVVRYDEPKRRVGVEFPRPIGVISLKPANLEFDAKEQADLAKKELERTNPHCKPIKPQGNQRR